MIIIKIELLSARTGKTTELGRMHISNDGTSDDPKKGNYNIELMRKGTLNKVLKKTRIDNWAKESYSVWKLLQKALNQLYEK